MQPPVKQNMSFLNIYHVDVDLGVNDKKSVSFHLLSSPSWMLCLRFVSPGEAWSCGEKVVFLRYYDPSPQSHYSLHQKIYFPLFCITWPLGTCTRQGQICRERWRQGRPRRRRGSCESPQTSLPERCKRTLLQCVGCRLNFSQPP